MRHRLLAVHAVATDIYFGLEGDTSFPFRFCTVYHESLLLEEWKQAG